MRPSDVGWVNYLGWLFISPRGRIPRSIYWAAKLGLFFTLVVVLAISVALERSNSGGDRGPASAPARGTQSNFINCAAI